MSKYTPGPWRVFAGTGFDYLGIEGENDQTVVIYGLDGDDGGVRGSTKEEAEANARLIAAAPELLEALEWTARALDKEHPAAIKARVAIAKAKGEHP